MGSHTMDRKLEEAISLFGSVLPYNLPAAITERGADTVIGKTLLPSNLAVQASGIAVPFVIEAAFTGAAAETHIYNAAVPFKMKILDVSVQITTAGASAAAITCKLDNGTSDITDAMAVNAAGGVVAAGGIVRATSIVVATATLAAGATLDITLSATTNAPAGVVRIIAIPVS